MFMDDECDVFFSDFKLDPDVFYFLYIGELKTDCLNQFVKETLTKIHGQPFDFISILPDVLESYPHKNTLVINPMAKELMRARGRKVSFRIAPRTFASLVSASSTVNNLIQQLLDKQGHVFIHVFESVPELTLALIPGVRILGPSGHISNIWNNKLYQLQMLKETAPLINYRVCTDADQMLETAKGLWDEWTDGIFVSQPYSAAGVNSFLATNQEEIEAKAGHLKGKFFISRYIPHQDDPTVLGVVANAKDVFIAAIADQEIQNGNMFRGSTFPSTLAAPLQQELREITRRVGRAMGRSGYRGIFGCDYVVDAQGRIFFVEVNARKQGTTMEMCCTLENALPPETPGLLELEYYAVMQNRFPDNMVEISEALGSLCWRTYNYKLDQEAETCQIVPVDEDERTLFRQVVADAQAHGVIVVEHVGSKLSVQPGTFLGRVVAVGHSRAQLEEDIRQGIQRLKESIFDTIQKTSIPEGDGT
ncbi:ATP-grasp domain-containing protein [Desulfonatronum thiosulfatophilum]|uniref:ATP-grasp domain-containing protein n=1 Tax=Desulfonatronum thiosulfatophilum TaxID=617002 RepID=A0A1G6A2U4_9BACT|nr:ATP-grasp domain-containing protein [Desulfonatronum thiosulfatophilum]SDB02536.1 ATP-grasp domain-containing protein [Desulfonatronum thiosulfatophilum]